jgi:Tol biopolymer transport system component
VPPGINVVKTHVVRTFSIDDVPLTTCRIDPTGSYVVAAAENFHIYRWPMSGPQSARTILHGHNSWVRSFDFSPDGNWVIFRSDRQKEHMLQIFAISVDGKHEIQLTNNLGTVNWAPYYHPSGRYIVWTRADYSRGPEGAHFNLYTMDLEVGKTTIKAGDVRQVTSNSAADVLPVFSPDGTKLMWTSARGKGKTSQLWIADWKRGAGGR